MGKVPARLSERIMSEDKAEILNKWLRLAAKADSLEEFEKRMTDL